jgi:hypothetical protein
MEVEVISPEKAVAANFITVCNVYFLRIGLESQTFYLTPAAGEARRHRFPDRITRTPLHPGCMKRVQSIMGNTTCRDPLDL